MFENSSLQELYTGSLIAGKGKHLNNIRSIMEKTKFKHEDWARVRFGAGTPWRRCWCVIEPPDEKEWQRATKSMKKRSAYERPAYPKGDIKFYDTKKTKKVTPIATITDAYAAYAIYPQSKPLIDQSTLVKIEGKITIHSTPESKTEGFVFIMPELHPAVSGFEMLLRFLFPVYDTYHLYGRPNRLIADTLDAKSLMFAMPKQRRYGYLDIMDVASLIHTQGSDKWSEREWRKQMKELTSRRMSNMAQNRSSSNMEPRTAMLNSVNTRAGIRYQDEAPSPVLSAAPASRGHQHSMSTTDVGLSPAKVRAQPQGAQLPAHNYHARAASESIALSPPKSRQDNGVQPSRHSMDRNSPDSAEYLPPPGPPPHAQIYGAGAGSSDAELLASRGSSDSTLNLQRSQSHAAEDVNAAMQQPAPPVAVAAPPTFQHQPTDRPQRRPDTRPEVRREKSRMSSATLQQMAEVNRLRDAGSAGAAGAAASAAWKNGRNDQPTRGVNSTRPDDERIPANLSFQKAMVADEITESPTDVSSAGPRQASQHSIRRKPLPTTSSQHSIPQIPHSEGSAELMIAKTRSSERARSPSNHDRDSSPDYASTRESEYDKAESPPRRVRTGVLKTVGDPNLGAESEGRRKSDIPDIDFGVTQSLTPGTSRPGTAMGISPSGSRPGTALGISPGGSRPSTAMEMLGGARTPERKSPLRTPEALASDDKRSSYFGRPSHSRSPSYAWQPGLASGRQSPGATQGLSAEEFVQQRAFAAQQPSGYVAHRSTSTNKIEPAVSPTTTQGPNKLKKKRDSRRDSRALSRNSTQMLDYSSNLSAREQEHVARMTGGPLINMSERSRTPDPSVGLIGAIEAREQERKQMREGVSGHLVQAAIAQRQHHANAQYMQAQQDAQRAYAQQYAGQSTNPWGQQYGHVQDQSQYTSWGAPADPQHTQHWQQSRAQSYASQHYYQPQGQQQVQHGGQQPYPGQQQQQHEQQNYGGYYQ